MARTELGAALRGTATALQPALDALLLVPAATDGGPATLLAAKTSTSALPASLGADPATGQVLATIASAPAATPINALPEGTDMNQPSATASLAAPANATLGSSSPLPGTAGAGSMEFMPAVSPGPLRPATDDPGSPIKGTGLDRDGGPTPGPVPAPPNVLGEAPPDSEVDWTLPQYTRIPGSVLDDDLHPQNGNAEPWEFTLGNPPVYTGTTTLDAELWGTNWSDNAISYSDPDQIGDYQAGYSTTPGQPNYANGFAQLSAAQLQAAHTILNQSLYTQLPGATGLSVEAFTGLSVTYAGTDIGTSTIRMANTSAVGTARVADFPGGNMHAGDVWFGGSGDNPTTGNYDYHTTIHELGHALGLKHGHDASNEFGAGAPVLPGATDSMEYSIMTYRSFVGGGLGGYTNEAWGYAQTYMMYDIQALQYIYGADYTANAGNTVYTWAPGSGNTVIDGSVALQPGGNRIFATLWDGNGIDTYDLSAYVAGVNVNLNPGSHSVFSSAQLADLDQFTAGRNASGNIYNALLFNGDLRSLIENAIGGSGNDTLTGNQGDNSLSGGGGNDSLIGGSGNDTLDGGSAADNMNGGLGDDLYIVDNVGDQAAEVAGGVDTVQSSATHTLSINLENLTLTGGADIDGTGNDSRDNVIIGNSGANQLSGLAGNDNLSGNNGVDTLLGGAGNDTLTGGSSTDSIDGGDGDDLIVFTAGHFYDSVQGGAGTDTLDASAVNRNGDVFDFELGTISGYPGGQTVAGIEVFLGGQGDETIISNGTGASYWGNGGNDSMIAEIGGETMDGGAGNDTIDLARWNGDYTIDMATGSSNYGGELYTNFENLVSGGGNDSITGTFGSNHISTGNGNDTVVATGSEDTIYGGAGNDLLQGGFVTDFVYGEAGDDTLQVLNGEFYDNSDGGDGVDTLDHSAADYSGTTFDFEAQTITGTGVNAAAFLRNIEIYQDGSGSNTIVSDGSAHFYYGNGGNDYMIAEIGGETMDGGAGGSDTIDLSRWNGIYAVDMSTGVSNWGDESFPNFEHLISGNGNDTITGTAGDNSISTQGGDDSINAGAGEDIVSAGAGNDVITDTVAMFATDDDVYDGGAGTDTLVHDLNWVSSVTFDLNAGWSSYLGNRDQLINIENLVVGGAAAVIGSALANVLTVNGIGTNSISGLGGNDIINAGGGDDTVSGGTGNDTILGGDGNDSMDGNTGDDSIEGGTGDDSYQVDSTADVVRELLNAGSDSVYSTAAAYTLSNHVENLYLVGAGNQTGIGSSVANLIVGQGGANQLDGFSGNDTLDGGAGNDTLNGGTGADSLIGAAGDDFLNGGAGVDTAVGGPGNDLYQVNSFPDATIENPGEGYDTVNSFSSNYVLSDNVEALNNRLTTGVQSGTGNAIDNVMTGIGADDVLYGLAGNDSIVGGNSNDSLFGGPGNDTLSGGTGNDSLAGAAGDDSLLGHAGNDTLVGGSNNDSMNGGSGDDDYVDVATGDVLTELGGDGYDRVFSSSSWTLDANFEYLQLTGSGNNGTGNGLDNTIVGNGNANTLTGLSGADTLLGKAGNDALYAGAGATEDRFVFDTPLDSINNVDTLYQSVFGEDQIWLANDVFSALLSTVGTQTGVLGAGYYFEGSGSIGNGASDGAGIWYDLDTGRLYYNPTSGLAGDSTLFAIIDGASANLDSVDFTLFAPPLFATSSFPTLLDPELADQPSPSAHGTDAAPSTTAYMESVGII